MSVDVAVVIVSWNVRPLLADCLKSILESPGARVPSDGGLELDGLSLSIWVVDNASSDGTVEMVREAFPRVRLIANKSNLGFTRGNNLVLKHCRDARYVLLLNPDTRLTVDERGRNALTHMVAYMDEHSDIGLLGPQLCFADGTLQSSRRRFPTLMTAVMESTLLERWFPENRWARAYHMTDVPPDSVQDVDWLVGACMLVRREVIDQVGLLDERFFMYSEELDWCRRIAKAGWRRVYYPGACVIHYEGQSSGQVVAERQRHFDTSKIQYFAKYHGRWAAELLRVFLLLTYVWLLGEEGLKYLLGHKRAMRLSRIRAYRYVLSSRLRPPSYVRG